MESELMENQKQETGETLSQNTLVRVSRFLAVVSRTIDAIVLAVSALLLVIMTVIVNVGVVYRYVLHNPIAWSEQVPKYAMVWMGLLGASVAISRNQHIGFDLLLDNLPGTVRSAIVILGRVIVLFLLVMLAYWGVVLSWAIGFTSKAPMMEVPMFYFLVSVPMASILMAIQTVIRLLDDIIEISRIVKQPDGTAGE